MFQVGDNLVLLRGMADASVDMVYMDPPYNTGRDFHYFSDKHEDFVAFMRERIVECHRVLRPNGNIIIHVEPPISHHMRNICDDVFLPQNFRNEIVWHSGGNAKNTRKLGRNHDTLIVYGKTKKSKFFPLYKPYDDSYTRKLRVCPHHKKAYSSSAAHNSQPLVNPRPNLRYEWNGHEKQWFVSKERMQRLHDDHRLEYNKEGVPRIKRFADEMEGIPVRDTWDDIPSIQGKEKTEYATQKPVRLLERIVRIYTEEGDVCLDPFAGSGTLGRACIRTNRDYVLFDINPQAQKIFETTTQNTTSG